MQFSAVLLAASAFALTNAAKFTMSSSAFVTVSPSNPLNITWEDASGPVTILLKNGDPNALKTVSTIASINSGNSFVWTPSASLTDGLYALEIDDATGPNYSVQFPLTGAQASGSASTTAASISSTASTTASGSTTIITTTSAASASTTASSGNSTAVTTSGSTTGTTTGTATTKTTATSTKATTSATTSAPATNSAAGFASPLALALLAFAAMMTIN